ncbi:MAG: hypothetical protein LBV69_06515 [Bacteroidales bacterium]|jgi:hypothetical protein|nr:hypothetical protein [Bacteroidales bacterium]
MLRLNNITVIDLFRRIDKLSQGFVMENFDVVSGYDNNVSCKHTYETNNLVNATIRNSINAIFKSARSQNLTFKKFTDRLRKMRIVMEIKNVKKEWFISKAECLDINRNINAQKNRLKIIIIYYINDKLTREEQSHFLNTLNLLKLLY